MAVIKQIPEDFIVREIPIEFRPGSHLLFTMKKKNLSTLEATGKIAEKLRIKPGSIGFAGNKDKRAVTEQLISLDNIPRHKIEGLGISNIQLGFFGRSEKRLLLGDLAGNEFIVTIRDLGEEAMQLKKHITMLNLFGQQRFSKSNVEAGLHLLRKDFESVVKLITWHDSAFGDSMKDFLIRHPNDFVNALRLIPQQLVKLYVHSVQSMIWNRTAEECMKRGILQDEIPVVGFGTSLGNDTVGEIINSMLEEYHLSPRDFIFREMPSISSEGGSRKMRIEVDINVKEVSEDDFHPGRKKAVVEFKLPKSSYATVVIDKLLP